MNVSDTVVLALTALLALEVPAWTVRGIWHLARHTTTRQRALSNVLGSIAGTTMLGVVLPSVLLGALNPFPIWLGYTALTVAAAVTLGWRWPALRPGRGIHPSLVITTCLLLGVLATAGIAAT